MVTKADVQAFMAERSEDTKANRFEDIERSAKSIYKVLRGKATLLSLVSCLGINPNYQGLFLFLFSLYEEVYYEQDNIKFRKHKNLELNLFTYYIKFNSEKIKLRRD